MITQEQIKGLQERVETLRKCVDIDAKRAEVEEKEKRSQEPDFWNDPKEAEAFLKGMSGVKSWVTAFDEASSAVDDLEVLLELEPDSPETDSAYARAVSLVEKLELRNMLGGEGDSLGAVLTINSGAGGTEANDWSAMLMRMYMRWGERNGYKMTVTELIDGDEAGIKSATVQFEGDYAYGYLKAESGVHRLVRISPFNAQGKRQTTFSSVFVYPLVDDTINIEINPSDIARPAASRTTARTRCASSSRGSTTSSSRSARRSRPNLRGRRRRSNGVRRYAPTCSIPTRWSRTCAPATRRPTPRECWTATSMNS